MLVPGERTPFVFAGDRFGDELLEDCSLLSVALDDRDIDIVESVGVGVFD